MWLVVFINVLVQIRLQLGFQENSNSPNVLRRMQFVVLLCSLRKSSTQFGSEFLLEGLEQFRHDGLDLLILEGVLCILQDE